METREPKDTRDSQVYEIHTEKPVPKPEQRNRRVYVQDSNIAEPELDTSVEAPVKKRLNRSRAIPFLSSFDQFVSTFLPSTSKCRDITVVDEKGYTKISSLILNKEIEELRSFIEDCKKNKVLLSKYINEPSGFNFETALLIACKTFQFEVAMYLLTIENINLMTFSIYGETVLFYTAFYIYLCDNYPELVEKQYGLDANREHARYIYDFVFDKATDYFKTKSPHDIEHGDFKFYIENPDIIEKFNENYHLSPAELIQKVDLPKSGGRRVISKRNRRQVKRKSKVRNSKCL